MNKVKSDGEKISEALKSEDKLKSYWHILTPKGDLIDLKLVNNNVSGFDFGKYDKLRTFTQYEMAKDRRVKSTPPHVTYMRKLEIADYEEGSDPGNLRYYPNGKLIRDLIMQYDDEIMVENGAMKIETPMMLDSNHHSLVKYMNRFPARQYIVESVKRKFFLRFASCFGQFLMMKDAVISYRNLPIWVYELAQNCFRLENRGELSGLRRVRTFVMPDCHAFCADMEQAKTEFFKRFNISVDLMNNIGFEVKNEFEFAIRVVRSFWDENKDFIKELVKQWNKPTLIEIWDERHFYFVLKYEFNFVDVLDKASALTTDQIDVENGPEFPVKFMDKDNKKKPVTILHWSPSGAICRVMYSLLERAAWMEKGGKLPILPFWLSPEQVRILPVADRHIVAAEKLSKKLVGVRVGIDDRAEGVPKKVAKVKSDWIPYFIVVGDKEAESGELNVFKRDDNKFEMLSIQSFKKLLKNKQGSMPFRKMYVPQLISKRPIFVPWGKR
ncbi:MAG: threonine--tRNA ligase [Nanoarchaeota archaeon]|nr:threonine--tRNA ligase [Nanoarchaeota archaeon]